MIKISKFTITCLVTLFFVFCQSQNSIVEYKIAHNIDLSKSKKTNSDIIKKIYSEMDKTVMQLTFNEKEALFKKKQNLDIGEESSYDALKKILTNEDDIYYKNIDQNEFILQKEFSSKLFLIDFENQKQEWKLTKEFKMIDDYKCFKAVLTEDYKSAKGDVKQAEIIAWYAPEIPSSFGPFYYGNLPGLILELTKQKLTFHAIKIALKQEKNEMSLEKPSKGKKVSQKEYDALTSKFMKSRGY